MPDDREMGYRRSLTIKYRGGSGGLQIVENVATGLRSGHELDAIVLEPKGDGGGRRRIGMDLNGQGAYHRLVYYQMLMPPSTTSNGCGQR
ncbi:hypothetical protein GOBAR_DD23377 [Gossypium barbadense]|nr:hypothetical protein GOBAR_DD23377 [Gossypium barbadense]